jgi:Raf kinase inhibitor-like YbhB/YbcL family protein
MPLKLTSTAFNNGSSIPTEHTCDGANFSPPLTWSEVPPGTKSLALLVNDPDAPVGNFTHWILFNIPPGADGLPENTAADERLDTGAIQGKNGFGNIGYGGPCPPAGDDAHRYFFRICALDTELGLDSNASMQDITAAMDGHIIEEDELMGTYSRHQAKAADTR